MASHDQAYAEQHVAHQLYLYRVVGRNVPRSFHDRFCCGTLLLPRLAEELEGQVDPFDDTRVHPECYNTQDWAQRICANALDVQVNNGRNTRPLFQDTENIDAGGYL